MTAVLSTFSASIT